MKIGFACKYLNNELNQPFSFKATTRKRFLSLDTEKREELIFNISKHNLENLYLTLEQLALLPETLRMMRIGSDLLPLYTVPEAKPLYAEFLPSLYPLFEKIGSFARLNNIRLSFHPGQYSVLASDNPNVIKNAIEDVEYHVFCAVLMGF